MARPGGCYDNNWGRSSYQKDIWEAKERLRLGAKYYYSPSTRKTDEKCGADCQYYDAEKSSPNWNVCKRQPPVPIEVFAEVATGKPCPYFRVINPDEGNDE